MPLSNAEIQRRFRERRRLEKAAAPDASASIVTRPFSEFLRERNSEAEFDIFANLDYVGVRISGDLFNDDHRELMSAWSFDDHELTTLGRSISMVGAFIHAAKELSGLINQYKLSEIDRQLETARGVKREKLEKLRQRLEKRTSHFFPVIEVKGD